MDPKKVAARFAAFVWITNGQPGKRMAADRAMRFARENWQAFLPGANEGLGRLLIRLARMKPSKTRRRAVMATAG